MLPFVTEGAAKIAPPLATGALSALGSLGIDELFGSGLSGGFLIPNEKVELLIKHRNLLTKNQKENILNALQSGGQVVIEPTVKRRGDLLGTVLASIGIPLVLKALTGGSGFAASGLQVPKKAASGLQVLAKPALYLYYPPPFYGSWDKKNVGKRIVAFRFISAFSLSYIGKVFTSLVAHNCRSLTRFP